MRLESTVRDLESKAAELASKITTLESALTSRDAQVVEMQKLIDLQNEVKVLLVVHSGAQFTCDTGRFA